MSKKKRSPKKQREAAAMSLSIYRNLVGSSRGAGGGI